MKKTAKINLPKGKEAYGITAIPYNGYIDVEFELKDEWKPKDGDFVTYIGGDNNICYTLIYRQQIGGYNIDSYVVLDTSSKRLYPDGILHYIGSAVSLATEEEKQRLLDALHEEGKDWDIESKKIVPYKWKPNKGDDYYAVNEWMEIKYFTWSNDYVDRRLYNSRNCFRTEEEAEAMRDRLQKVLNGAKLEGE